MGVCSNLPGDPEVKLFNQQRQLIGNVQGGNVVTTNEPVAYYWIMKGSKIRAGLYVLVRTMPGTPTLIMLDVTFDVYPNLRVDMFLAESGFDLLVWVGEGLDNVRSTLPVANWQERMLASDRLIRECITSGKYGSLSAIARNPIRKKHLLRGQTILNKQQVQDLKVIMQDGSQGISTAATGAGQDVNNMKTSPTNTWQTKMDAADQKLRQKLLDEADMVAQKGREYVDGLPPDQRDAGANMYIAGTEVLGEGAGLVFNQLMGIVDSLVNLIKGIWDQFNSYISTIKDIGNSVINAIAHIFG